MAEETTTTPPAEGVTLSELKDAITAGVTTGVVEALKANAPAPPADPPAAEPQEDAVAKAVAEAMAAKEAEFEKRLDQATAEMRRVQVKDRDPEIISEADFYASQTSGPAMRGAAGKASDMVYIEQQLLKSGMLQSGSLREHPAIRKALDTATDGHGADWVPTSFSQQFIADIRASMKLPAAFPHYTLATKTQKFPVQGGYATGYLVAENTTYTDRASNITEGGLTTNDVELSAKKLAIRILQTFEYEQDAFPQAMSIIRQNLIDSMARCIEDAIVNGDTADTHMDADVTAATDRRKAWIGLRGKAMDDTSGNVDISTFTADNLMKLKKNLGEYGLDIPNLVWVASVSAWNQMLLLRDAKDNIMVTTVDKYGPQATVLTGEMGKFLGIPVIPSAKMREDLNASGVYDGTTKTKTGILLTWLPAWAFGDKQEVALEVQRFSAAQNTDLVLTGRFDFKHALGTNVTTVMGYNLAS